MKRTHLVGYVVAGAVVFATGYAFGGGAAADTIAALRKQPASMLTVGLLGANAALSQGRITTDSKRFIVSKSLPPHSSAGACTVELESLRRSIGVRYDNSGVKISRSIISKHFLAAEEQSSNDPGVLARRDAIDEATTVRILGPLGTACEGPLLTKP